MKNSNLIPLLQSLNAKELRECMLWLQSPLHNSRNELCRLYDYLTNEATGFREECLERGMIWNVLFPNEAQDDNRFRQLVHLLLRAIEDFLAYQHVSSDPVRMNVYLLKELRARRIEKLFEKRMREAEKAQQESKLRNARFLENQYLLEMEKFSFAENQPRTAPLNLQEISDTFDIQYLAQRLRNECHLHSRQTVYKSNYQSKLLEEALQKVEEYNWQSIPAVGIYYYCYLSLTNKNHSESHFQHLLNYLENAHTYLPEQEVRDVYLLAINYVIKRINTGDPNAVQQAYNLYKNGVEQGFLIINGVLSQWTYRNAVICGTRLGEFAWTEQFIHQYNSLLERKYRLSMQQECLSKLYYARKDYQKAMQLLLQVDFKDILQNITAKTMLAKIYYELEEWEALESLLVSMKAYIRRKRVIGYHQENYNNFIRFAQKLLSSNLLDKEIKNQLVTEIQQASPLTEKAWLLERLGG